MKNNMNSMDELDPKLQEQLNLLNETSARDMNKAALGKSQFLHQAQQYASSVTGKEKMRHNKWFTTKFNNPVATRKERSFMINFLSVLLIAASLVLGGGGVTVAAAQSTIPGDPLYAVKLWSEDLRMDLATNNETQYELALDFADRRVEEIQELLQSGETLSETAQMHLQTQLTQAIQAALGLPDEKAVLALEQIRTRMETQLQLVTQMQQKQSSNAALLQTSTMLQERLNWLNSGLSNPAQLREQEQIQLQTGQPVEDQPQPGNDLHPTIGNQAPANGDGNPWTTGTPTPGSSYGPGPGTGSIATCTPSGTGSGSGTGNPSNGSPSGQGGNH